jgi:hypothetical protein
VSINAVGNHLATASFLDVQQSSATQPIGALLAGGISSTGSTSGVASSSFGDSAQISGPGKLFSELQQVASQNPTEFKQLTGQIATQLQNAAQQATGGLASFLTALANKFESASTTGDVSLLQPPQGGPSAGTYNAQGQVSQSLLADLNSSDSLSSSGSLGLASLLGGGSSSSTASLLTQLLSGISSSSSSPSSSVASSTGASNLSSLLGGGAYTSSGTSLVQLLGGSSSNGLNHGQLFQTISTEVKQALKVSN